MFRSKESSNKIELSRLVQVLLNFGVFGSLWLWGVWGGWMGVGGGWGMPPTHVHLHTHAHACMVNMIISCKWPLPLGESMGIPNDVICACVCMHAHACMHMCVHMCGGTLSPPLPPFIHPVKGDPQNQSKFNSA